MSSIKKLSAAVFGGILALGALSVEAAPIRTPEGNMPRVQWAVVESTAGNLQEISDIGARVLAPVTAKETGTYALYGVVEKDNPDLMRLLEIYESDEAYRIHSTSEAFQQYRAERLPILKGLKILPVNAIVLEQKKSGVGEFVQTHRYEVAPKDLAKFQQILAAEAIRAVREDSGVLGMFVTAEQANPNIIHTMEIFKDSAAHRIYTGSKNYKAVRRQINSLIQTERQIDYLPAKISLTQKAWH